MQCIREYNLDLALLPRGHVRHGRRPATMQAPIRPYRWRVGHRLGQLRRLGRRARSGRLERGRRAARREGARVAEGRVRDTEGEG